MPRRRCRPPGPEARAGRRRKGSSRGSGAGPHGAKLRPRGTLQPGTPVEVLVNPPDARPVRVSGVVWRVDSEGRAVLFLGGIPAGLAAQGLGAAAADYK